MSIPSRAQQKAEGKSKFNERKNQGDGENLAFVDSTVDLKAIMDEKSYNELKQIQTMLEDKEPLKMVIDTFHIFLKQVQVTFLVENRDQVKSLMFTISQKLIEKMDVNLIEDFIRQLRVKFQNTTSTTFKDILVIILDEIVNLQTLIPHNFNNKHLPANLLALSTQGLLESQKILGVIMHSGKLILEQLKELHYDELSAQAIQKLMRTCIMFNRVQEARVFMEIYNQIKIIEDNPQKCNDLLIERDQTKINCACCLLSLNMYDDCKKLLMLISGELQTQNRFDYMNVAAKYFRLTKQWLPLAVSLVNCLKLKGFSQETMTYAIEAQLLDMSLDYYNVDQSALELACNDQFSLNSKLRQILLLNQIPTFPDFTNQLQKSQGVRGEVHSYLAGFCTFNKEFQEFIKLFSDLKQEDYLQKILISYNQLVQIDRDYVNYADLLINKMVQNAALSVSQAGMTVQQMFEKFDAVLKQQLRGEEVLTLPTLIQLIKKLQRCGVVQWQLVDSQLKGELKQNCAQKMLQKLQKMQPYSFQQLVYESRKFKSVEEQLQEIAERKEEMVALSRKLFDEEEERIRKQKVLMQEKEAEKQLEMKKQQQIQNSVTFYTKNCRQYIIDNAQSINDEEMYKILQQTFDELMDEFDAKQVPSPDQWMSVLNNKANEFNKARLEQRIKELRQDMFKIEARLHFTKATELRQTMVDKCREQEKLINDLRKQMVEQRFKAETRNYEAAQQYMLQFNEAGIQAIAADQDLLDQEEQKTEFEKFNAKVEQQMKDMQEVEDNKYKVAYEAWEKENGTKNSKLAELRKKTEAAKLLAAKTVPADTKEEKTTFYVPPQAQQKPAQPSGGAYQPGAYQPGQNGVGPIKLGGNKPSGFGYKK